MIHLDLDAFFISAERIIKPYLRNIPAAVGGRGDPFIFDPSKQNKLDTTHTNRGAFVPSIFYDAKTSFEEYFVEGQKIRGIIVTASYEARKYGVKTGMTIKEALQICPHLQVVPPNHLYYHHLSTKLKRFLQKEIPAVEQFSIDEFFGDLRGWIEDGEVEEFLRNLQHKIMQKFQLPISIGAAKSKWIAKLATSYAKPKGIKVVRDIPAFIHNIPIEEFPGIGRGYLKRLKRYGINTLGETKDAKEIFYSWKKPGITLYKRIWGMDNEGIASQTPRKSIGISRTIDPISDRIEIKRRIVILARHLAQSVTKLSLHPACIYFGIKYESGFKAKAHKRIDRVFSEKLLIDTALALFSECDMAPTSSIMRIALSCSCFANRRIYNMIHLQRDYKLSRLSRLNSHLREKFGNDAVLWGVEFIGGKAAKEKQIS